MKWLVWSNQLFVQFFQLVSLGLNLFLCIDLVLTLWSPFEVARSRMKYYYAVSTFTSGALITIIWFNQDKSDFENEDFSDKSFANNPADSDNQ